MSTSPLQQATTSELLTPTAATGAAPAREWPDPGGLYLFGLGAAIIGANAALLAAAVLTLSLKATAIDSARATTILSVVVAVAGLAMIVADPALGRLSDRTTGRRPRAAGAPDHQHHRGATSGGDTGWDSGWVESHQHLLVPWTGPRLASSQRVTWRVAVRTDAGQSPTSAPCWFEAGLLEEDDWQEVGDFAAFVAADEGEVATAYLAHSAGLASRIAAVLGREDDAARYAALSARVRAAWQAEYLAPDGRLSPDTQANHVRALAFDLVPDDARAGVADRLVALVREAGTRLGTGFLATPHLLPVLAGTGHLDVAHELLLRGGEPSWLAMVDRGSTTVWERWDGVSADGVPHESLNHCSKGAVVSFLHRVTAGIELLDDAPAYRRFRVRPRPGGDITWVRAAHESPHGRIEVDWQLDGAAFALRVLVPAGTQAEVVLPDGRTAVAGPGEHAFTDVLASAPERGRREPRPADPSPGGAPDDRSPGLHADDQPARSPS